MAKRPADLRQAMLSGARAAAATHNARAVEPPAETCRDDGISATSF